jgi:hypothetical protein
MRGRIMKCSVEGPLENFRESLHIDPYLSNDGILAQNSSFVFSFVDMSYTGSAKATAVVHVNTSQSIEVESLGY